MLAGPLPRASKRSMEWPWGDALVRMQTARSDGSAWPRISVITPNYNYGEFLEETIRSVLLQGYPNLEYIVIDGGSSDNSLEVIHKYEPWLSHWESEKDKGQADAINKGFARASGEIIAWLNSDDVLLPGALRQVAEAYNVADEKLIFASVVNFLPDGREEVVVQSGIELENFVGIPRQGFRWHQPGMFVPRSFYCAVGGLDLSLHYVFDWEWICRLLIHRPEVTCLKDSVARFRVHEASKTGESMMNCWLEAPRVVRRHIGQLPGYPLSKVLAYYDLRVASLSLAEHAGKPGDWSRRRGIGRLLRVVLRDPAALSQPQFRRLIIRALLPRCLYRSR